MHFFQMLTSVLQERPAAAPTHCVQIQRAHIPALVNLDILEMEKSVQVRYYSHFSLQKRDKTEVSSSRSGLWDFYSGQAKDVTATQRRDLNQICFRFWLFYFLLLQRADKAQQVDETKPCRFPVKLFYLVIILLYCFLTEVANYTYNKRFFREQ